jgi:hypothetical protein
LAIALAATLAICATGDAQGVKTKRGNVVVSFDGGISPEALPRSGTAPVTVNISSNFEASDGADPPPQLRQIAIGINREGKVFDRGLPTCQIRRIQPSTIRAARRICGGAIVGKGNVGVRVKLGSQPPFTFKAPLLVFNAEPSGGKRRLLAQVYGRKPPSAFVLTFTVTRQGGPFGTLIQTTLPEGAQKWAYVTRFEMTLNRTYTYRGEQRSFISAGCPAPDGFSGAPAASSRLRADRRSPPR